MEYVRFVLTSQFSERGAPRDTDGLSPKHAPYSLKWTLQNWTIFLSSPEVGDASSRGDGKMSVLSGSISTLNSKRELTDETLVLAVTLEWLDCSGVLVLPTISTRQELILPVVKRSANGKRNHWWPLELTSTTQNTDSLLTTWNQNSPTDQQIKKC
mmetsp:Transcript_6995/g.14414  ORF Transcript_6995/g.14414 Transcript_6995/m.14414 type:complete len:156 (+) Transcript_6995:868-1335(+)